MNSTLFNNPINELKDPNLLTTEELEGLLPLCDELIKWAEDIKELALSKALSGTRINGYKVVEGRALRKWNANEDEVALKLTHLGISQDIIYEKKLASVSKIEKVLGKATFKNALEHLTIKPQGKPTLVESSDKRPEFTQVSSEEFEF